MPESSLLASGILVLVWELGVGLLSVLIAHRIVQHRDTVSPTAPSTLLGFAICVIASDIVLESTIGSGVAFLRLNSRFTYTVIAALVFGGSLYGCYRCRIFSDIWKRQISEWLQKLPAWVPALAILVWLPYLLDAMQSVRDVDSVYNMTFVHGWFDNRFTPYQFAQHYVAFWEAGYLPNLLLTQSDSWLWLHSAKPVLLSFVGLVAIGKHFRLPTILALLSAASTMSAYYFWNSNSGIGTIKNDMAVSSGVILAAYAICDLLDHGCSRKNIGILFLAIALASVKYTGPFLVVAIWLALACACLVTRRRLPQHWFGITSGAMMVALLVAGHYFLKNAVLFSNPLYPCQINFFGWQLPGYLPTEGTSIWDHFGEWRMWKKVLLPDTILSPAGAFVPGVIIATLPVCGAILISGIRKPADSTTQTSSLVFLATLIAGTWFIYVRSFWSAGTNAENLFYLDNLASLRFATGTLGVTELFLVIVAYRSKIPVSLIGAVLVLQLISRIAILEVILWRDSYSWDGPMLFHGISVIAAALCMALVIRQRMRGFVISGLLLLTLAAPIFVQINHRSWLPEWRPIWGPIHEIPSQRIAVIRRPAQESYTYPVAGHRFQHTIITLDQTNLPQVQNFDCEYVVIFRPMYWKQAIQLPAERQMNRFGFKLLGQSRSGAVYQRMNRDQDEIMLNDQVSR